MNKGLDPWLLVLAVLCCWLGSGVSSSGAGGHGTLTCACDGSGEPDSARPGTEPAG